MSLEGSILVGTSNAQYRLLRRPSNGGRAAGAQGEVWIAEKLETRAAEVAIKLLDRKGIEGPEAPARTRRFEREKEALHALSACAEVPNLLDEGSYEGRPFFVMSAAPGETLDAARETQGGTISLFEAGAIMEAVARAVAKVHDANIVHRDLKPGNIFFEQAGSWRAKLADFGIAKSAAEAGASSLTGLGEAIGTPSYMPPEQGRRAKWATPAADVFGFAATFLHALTGKHHRVSRAPHPNLPPEVARVFDKALEPHPNDRFPSALELLAALGPHLP